MTVEAPRPDEWCEDGRLAARHYDHRNGFWEVVYPCDCPRCGGMGCDWLDAVLIEECDMADWPAPEWRAI